VKDVIILLKFQDSLLHSLAIDRVLSVEDVPLNVADRFELLQADTVPNRWLKQLDILLNQLKPTVSN